jgi:hypothetical protein
LCEAAAILADLDHPDAPRATDRIAALDRAGTQVQAAPCQHSASDRAGLGVTARSSAA